MDEKAAGYENYLVSRDEKAAEYPLATKQPSHRLKYTYFLEAHNCHNNVWPALTAPSTRWTLLQETYQKQEPETITVKLYTPGTTKVFEPY